MLTQTQTRNTPSQTRVRKTGKGGGEREKGGGVEREGGGGADLERLNRVLERV
jgi:hypothetical protein